MIINKKITLILISCIILYFLFVQLSPEDRTGKPFLLTFEDVLSGATISTEDYLGKIVVVVFWFSECPPCRDEIIIINELYSKYHDEGVEFIGINFDSDIQQVIDYCIENNVLWPQYSEEGRQFDTTVALDWNVDSTPTVFILDRNGIIYSDNARYNLEEIILELLREE